MAKTVKVRSSLTTKNTNGKDAATLAFAKGEIW